MANPFDDLLPHELVLKGDDTRSAGAAVPDRSTLPPQQVSPPTLDPTPAPENPFDDLVAALPSGGLQPAVKPPPTDVTTSRVDAAGRAIVRGASMTERSVGGSLETLGKGLEQVAPDSPASPLFRLQYALQSVGRWAAEDAEQRLADPAFKPLKEWKLYDSKKGEFYEAKAWNPEVLLDPDFYVDFAPEQATMMVPFMVATMYGGIQGSVLANMVMEGGNAYRDAINNGASENQALGAAALTAAAQIPTTLVTQLPAQLIPGTSINRLVSRFIVDVLGEGGEEFLQSIASQASEKYVYNENKLIDAGQALEEAALAFPVATTFQAGGSAIRRARYGTLFDDLDPDEKEFKDAAENLARKNEEQREQEELEAWEKDQEELEAWEKDIDSEIDAQEREDERPRLTEHYKDGELSYLQDESGVVYSPEEVSDYDVVAQFPPQDDSQTELQPTDEPQTELQPTDEPLDIEDDIEDDDGGVQWWKPRKKGSRGVESLADAIRDLGSIYIRDIGGEESVSVGRESGKAGDLYRQGIYTSKSNAFEPDEMARALEEAHPGIAASIPRVGSDLYGTDLLNAIADRALLFERQDDPEAGMQEYYEREEGEIESRIAEIDEQIEQESDPDEMIRLASEKQDLVDSLEPDPDDDTPIQGYGDDVPFALETFADDVARDTGKQAKLTAVEPTTDAEKSIVELGKQVGTEVVYFESDIRISMPASIDPRNPKRIFIRKGDEAATRRLFHHEVVHSLRRTAPELYGELVAFLKQNSSTLLEEKGRREYRGRVVAAGHVSLLERLDSDKAMMQEEAVAQLAEMLSPNLLTQLQTDNPTLYERLVQLVKDIVDRLAGVKLATGERVRGDLAAEARSSITALNDMLEQAAQGDTDTAVRDGERQYAYEATEDRNGFTHITGPEGERISIRMTDADFPGDTSSPTRGELWYAEVPEGRRRQGLGGDLAREALQRMTDAGAETVVLSAVTDEGQSLVDSLQRNGLIGDAIRTAETGKSEHRILVEDPDTAVREDDAVPYAIEPDVSPKFYSSLVNAVEGIDFRSMPASDLLARIRNTRGIKAEELEATRFEQWLQQNTGKVTKKDAMLFLAENQVLVEVTRKHTEQVDEDALWPGFTETGTASDSPVEERYWMITGQEGRYKITELSNGKYRVLTPGGLETLRDTYEKAVREVKRAWRAHREGFPDPPKYPGEVIRGAHPRTYQEMLLTLPDSPAQLARARIFREYVPRLADLQRRINREVTRDDDRDWERLREERNALEDERDARALAAAEELGGGGEEVFRHSHWDEPNVLLHIRFNERTDRSGNRVLFLEEVQSDWHQRGREVGYVGDLVKEYKSYDETPTWLLRRILINEDMGNQEQYEGMNRDGLLRAAIRQDKEIGGDSGPVNSEGQPWMLYHYDAGNRETMRSEMNQPPSAPFKKTWPALAFKHVLDFAVSRGMHRIAWTTGDQQNDRWDLSKHVTSISYKANEDTDPVMYHISAHGRGRALGTVFDDWMDAEELRETVGVEIAQKIINDEGTPNPPNSIQADYSQLRDTDLRVGGEPMRAFYDKMFPNMVGKYIKKLDKKHPGVTVGEIVGRQTTELTADRHYEGPELSAEEIQHLVYEYGGSVGNSLLTIKHRIEEGVTLAEAMSEYGSDNIAEIFGGKMVREHVESTEQLGIDITDALKTSVSRGQSLFALEQQPFQIIPEPRMRDLMAMTRSGGTARILVLDNGMVFAADANVAIHDDMENVLYHAGIRSNPVAYPIVFRAEKGGIGMALDHEDIPVGRERAESAFAKLGIKIQEFKDKAEYDVVPPDPGKGALRRDDDTSLFALAPGETRLIQNKKEIEDSIRGTQYGLRGALFQNGNLWVSDSVDGMHLDIVNDATKGGQPTQPWSALMLSVNEETGEVRYQITNDAQGVSDRDTQDGLTYEDTHSLMARFGAEQEGEVEVAGVFRGTRVPGGPSRTEDPDTRFAIAPPEDSEAFLGWWRQSKVVDENGDPRVVFHGSAAAVGEPPISQFDPEKRGKSTWARSAEKAFFFTSNPTVAHDFATFAKRREHQEPDKYPYTLPVYLSIQNPHVVDSKAVKYGINDAIVYALANGHDGVIFKNIADSPGRIRETRAKLEVDGWEFPNLEWENSDLAWDLEKYHAIQRDNYLNEDDYLFDKEAAKKSVDEFLKGTVDYYQEQYDLFKAGKKTNEYLEENDEQYIQDWLDQKSMWEEINTKFSDNPDLVRIAPGDNISDVYAVFEPTQIKSAIENVGTYDPENPDIRYALSPTEKRQKKKVRDTIFKRDKRRAKDASVAVQVEPVRDVAANLDRLDAALEKHGNPLENEEAWRTFTHEVTGGATIVMPPYEAIRWINNPDAFWSERNAYDPNGLRRAKDGIEAVKTARAAWTSGKISRETSDVALPMIVLWNQLSAQISPFQHEAAFLDLVNAGVADWIHASRDGKFDKAEYERWYTDLLNNKLLGNSPGAVFTKNSAIQRNWPNTLAFLASEAKEGGRAGTVMSEVLYDMMRDPSMTGRRFRREYSLARGFRERSPGIDTKLLSFMLLGQGFTDVMIFDRVQVNNVWDSKNRAAEYNLPILSGEQSTNLYDWGDMTKLFNNMRGLAISEVFERAIDEVLLPKYDMGEGSVGRVHWETYNAASGQDAEHSTLVALYDILNGTDPKTAINGVFSRQGKYGPQYGFEYGYVDGVPIRRIEGPSFHSGGKATYFFNSHSEVTNYASKVASKVLPKGVSAGSLKYPFTEHPEYDRGAHEEVLVSGPGGGIFQDGDRAAQEFADRVNSRDSDAKDQRRIIARGSGLPSLYAVEPDVNPTFYSSLRRAVESFDFRSMPASDLLARLKNTQGIKADELDATRLEQWLQASDRVGKDEVLEFLDENQVRVEVVQRGGTRKNAQMTYTVNTIGYGPLVENLDTLEEAEQWIEDHDGEYHGEPMWVDEEETYEEDGVDHIDDPETRYSSWVTPGAVEGSYREMLLTLPERPETSKLTPTLLRERLAQLGYVNLPASAIDVIYSQAEEGSEVFHESLVNDLGLSEVEATRVVQSFDTETIHLGNFHHPHWGETNVLAFTRFDERTDMHGNRVLFLEEVQSDWHQAGRKHGYLSPHRADETHLLPPGWSIWSREEMDDGGGEPPEWATSNFYVLDSRTDPIGDGGATPEEAVDNAEIAFPEGVMLVPTPVGAMQEPDSGAVPDAPFKKTWPELVFKHLLGYAESMGIDRIAWTRGSQQVSRYESRDRRVVEEISWRFRDLEGWSQTRHQPVVMVKGLNGGQEVWRDYFTVDGKQTDHTGRGYPLRDWEFGQAGKKLSAVVGADVANRILADPESGSIASEPGEDPLTIGGEGMKGFYDKMFPSMVGKYIKKLDRDHPGVQEIEVRGIEQKLFSPATTHGAPLTVPGQMQFVDEGDTEILQNWEAQNPDDADFRLYPIHRYRHKEVFEGEIPGYHLSHELSIERGARWILVGQDFDGPAGGKEVYGSFASRERAVQERDRRFLEYQEMIDRATRPDDESARATWASINESWEVMETVNAPLDLVENLGNVRSRWSAFYEGETIVANAFDRFMAEEAANVHWNERRTSSVANEFVWVPEENAALRRWEAEAGGYNYLEAPDGQTGDPYVVIGPGGRIHHDAGQFYDGLEEAEGAANAMSLEDGESYVPHPARGNAKSTQLGVILTDKVKERLEGGQSLFAYEKGERVGDGQRARSLPVSLEEQEMDPGTDITYTPITNEETDEAARSRVAEDPWEAQRWLEEQYQGHGGTAETSAVALRLMEHHQNTAARLDSEGKKAEATERYAEAVRLTNLANARATEAGQETQAWRLVSFLSPVGVQRAAQKIIDRQNEQAPGSRPKREFTPEMAQKFVDLGKEAQKWGVLTDEAKHMARVTQKVNHDQPLTADDIKVMKRWVKKVRGLLGEELIPAPRPTGAGKPTPKSTGPRGWTNVLTNKLSNTERNARALLKERGFLKAIWDRKGKLEPEVQAAFSEMGAGVMHRVGKRYADWSAEMLKDMGEDAKPFLRQIYKASEARLKQHSGAARKIATQANRIQDLISLWEENADYLTADLDQETSEYLGKLVDRVRETTGDAQVEAAQMVQLELGMLEDPTIGRYVSTYQTISHLLNPLTNIRNIVGNELFYRLERLNRYLAAPIDWSVSKLTGRDRTVTFRTGGQGKYWRDLWKGMRYGWKGTSPAGLVSQFDLTLEGQAFRGTYNPLTYMEKLMGATLRGFDYAAYSRAAAQVKGETAVLAAFNTGKKPTQKWVEDFVQNKLDPKIHEMADEAGKYVTFQDENVVSRFFVSLKRTLNRLGLGQREGQDHKDFGLGDLVLKYPKTPANLMARAIDYSPAGILRSLYILAEPRWKNVEANPREATLAVSRAITGTGLTLVGVHLLLKGVLSGDDDRDWDVTQFRADQTGERAYQVNLSAIGRWVKSGFNDNVLKKRQGDMLYSYDWAQPIAVNLAMGAAVGQSIKEGRINTGDLLSALPKAVAEGTETLAQQPLLQGVKELFGGGYNQRTLDRLGKIVEGIPAQMVPTFVNQIRKATGDNISRISYDPNPVQKAINRALYRMPVFYKQLPVAYKTLGVDMPREVYRDGGNDLFSVFLNPGFVARYQVNEQAIAIMQPYDDALYKTQFPRRAQRKIVFRSQKFIRKHGQPLTMELSADDFSKVQRMLARFSTKRMPSRKNLVGLDQEDQVKKLTDAFNDAWTIDTRRWIEKNLVPKYMK